MSYANKLSSYEHSFLLRATTAHAHPGDDRWRGQVGFAKAFHCSPSGLV